MPRQREPVALIKAKGKSHHLTKAEAADREASELKVPFTEIKVPSALTKKSRREAFQDIAAMLDSIGIWTELDETILTMFVIAQDQFFLYSKKLDAYFRKRKDEEIDWKEAGSIQMMQSSAFNQALKCASKLGLTITDRCRIVAPKVEDEKKPNKFNSFRPGGLN